jgi:two-component system, LytTR family, response regulator
MNAVLIDDDQKNLKILRRMLEEFCPEVTITGEAMNAVSGLALLKTAKPAIVFLDIEMPYGNAFELLDQLVPVDFEIIFITAFDEYSLKAFRYSAVDYLLKPVDIEQLKAAVNKVFEKQQLKTSNARLSNLLSNLSSRQNNLQKIAIATQDGLLFISLQHITRCEASKNYTYFHLQGGKKIIASKNILEYEELLPPDMFYRIHNSHLINLNYISSYQKGRGGSVVMEDGTILEVAARRKEEFLARFNR